MNLIYGFRYQTVVTGFFLLAVSFGLFILRKKYQSFVLFLQPGVTPYPVVKILMDRPNVAILQVKKE